MTSPLPFDLPDRPRVRRIRNVAAPPLDDERAQPMRGFDPRYSDIVDYIVRITDEIWDEQAVGLINNTYDRDCVVYTSYGIVRGADTVMRNTIAAIAATPGARTHHLNVAWGGDEADFYTAHLGFDDAIHLKPTLYGPATGRRYQVRFAADCISRANHIHTEWLVRDNGAIVRQIGADLDEVARRVAERPVAEPYVALQTETPAQSDLADWVADLFDGTFNQRRFDRLSRHYARKAIIHSGGGRTAHGLLAISTLWLSLIASIPDGRFSVEHVCWSDETNGIIIAVRWLLVGTSARGGLLGDELPVGRPVTMMGCSHLRLAGRKIVEEWTVFDEVAVLAMAYRA